MYFYNARYYDPTLARFTSADTIVPNSENPLGFVNSAIPIPYSLQVDLVDKRTFIGGTEPFVSKDGMCYPLVPPQDESYDLCEGWQPNNRPTLRRPAG